MRKLLFVLLFSFGTISAATMRHFNIDVEGSNIPTEQVVELFGDWFNLPNNTSFVQSNMMSDEEGYVHYCYNQYINGIIVYGGQILVHSTNGIVQYINGVVLETEDAVSPVTNKIVRKHTSTNAHPEIIIIPVKNETDFRYAFKYASEELGANVYIDSENGDTLNLSSYYSNVQTKITTNTIYSGRQKLTVEKSGTQCQYSGSSPRIETINSTNVYFRAGNEGWNNFYTNQIQNATAYTETEADSLNSYLTAITYHRMETDWCYDLEEGDTYPDFYIKIYNSSNVLVYQSQVYKDWKDYITFNPMLRLDGDTYTVKLYDEDFLNDDYAGYFTISSPTRGIGSVSRANFDVTVEVTGNPIRDAHWGMEKTLAYYKNILNRNSYDGNGAAVYQFVNPFCPGRTPNNSSARLEAPYCIIYGLGDGIKYHPLVALDAIAHEFTHMVTAHNIAGGLEQGGESVALNEGFSDIFGVLVEGYTYGQYDWTIGEKNEVVLLYTRSFVHPKSSYPSQPTTYGKYPWESNDDGHINCSILNYWFYLLCNGGSGTNDNQNSYNVQGVGISNATKIAYNTLMYGLTKTATFADAREGTIKETIKLYGNGSQEHQSVINAWYAVGVGGQYAQMEFPNPGKYVIVANRNKDNDKSWYYMTSDLGTASTKRFQAVNTTVSQLSSIVTSDLEDKYVWELEKDGNNYKLKNGNKYVTWTSGNSANLSESGKSLTFDITDNAAKIHFNDGTAERYLSLNANTSNNFFAFYGNTNQITDLYFLPYDEGAIPPPPVTTCKAVPYAETFASSQGDFTIQNVILPSGFTSIWNWDSQYGMVAKCIKNNTKYESESWLISPCIEMPESGSCILTFKHAAKFFSSTSQMTLWVSADYEDGLPSTATWQQLTIPTYPTGSNWNWYESGEIDLSAYRGQSIHIAFCYTSTASYAPQWEIKDFEIIQDASTSINNVMLEPSAIKVIRDGQILILRGEKVYTVTGQEVR